jgi:hypothetical protein
MRRRTSRLCFCTLASVVTAFFAVTASRPAQADAGDFTPLTSSPANLTCVTVNPQTNIIYAQQNQGTGFYSYNAASNSWTTLAPSPLGSGNNGGAAFANGKIFTVYRGNSAQMGVYDIRSNSWSVIANPLGQGTGNIASSGNDLYLAAGTAFVRYSAVSSTTTILASPPFAFEPWGGLQAWGSQIYGHQGSGNTGFATYNISSNTWKKLPNVPGGAVLGSAIDNDNGFYYAYGPYNGNKLYIYNLYANVWSTVPVPTFSVDDGGMAYISGGSYEGLYLIQGEDGSGFARFESYPFSSYGASINGSGYIANSNSRVKASFSATYNQSGLAGVVLWVDKINNVTFQSTSIISIVTVGEEAAIYGVGKMNGVDGYTFVLYTEDNLPAFIGRGDGVALNINSGWYGVSSYFNPGDSRVIPGFIF